MFNVYRCTNHLNQPLDRREQQAQTAVRSPEPGKTIMERLSQRHGVFNPIQFLRRQEENDVDDESTGIDPKFFSGISNT